MSFSINHSNKVTLYQINSLVSRKYKSTPIKSRDSGHLVTMRVFVQSRDGFVYLARIRLNLSN